MNAAISARAITAAARHLRRQWWRWLIAAFLVLFPLARLLPLDGQFYVDWYNHKWLAAYSGEYLRQHGSVPVVVNSTKYAGIPTTIFYGTLLYPVTSLLTVSINPGVAIRIVALLVTWLQYRLVVSALVRAEVAPWTSRGVAALVIWATYPLTNLYNRAAITEFVATGLLVGALASWFLLLRARTPAERIRLALGFGLLIALAAGAHPITAFYSLPILVLLVVAAYLEQDRTSGLWRMLIRTLAPPTVLTMVVLAPWAYALGTLGHDLPITSPGPGLPFVFSDSIDLWSTRFFPVPLDNRILDTPVSQLSTPFLDAQVNFPLAMLLLGWLAILLWRNRDAWPGGLRSIATGILAFAFFTWLSLSPIAYDLLPSSAKVLQFTYRTVTYQNLALLLATFMLAGFVRRRRLAGRPLIEEQPRVAGLVLGCLVLSGSGVLIKWTHASAIMKVEGSSTIRTLATERKRWTVLPEQFYGAGDYATPGLYRALDLYEGMTLSKATFPIGTGRAFGEAQPLYVSLARDTWVATNAIVFAWNHIDLDGSPVSPDQLRVQSAQFVVRVPRGLHALALRTVPDPIWVVLRAVSFGVLALWFAGFLYLGRQRRPRPAPAAAGPVRTADRTAVR